MASFPRGVHFVGSLPVSDAQEAFSVVSEALPNRIERLPDGETADRSQWVNWQTNTFKHVPRLQRCIDSGLEPEEIPSVNIDQIPEMLGTLHTGYDRVALDSFEEFNAMKQEGIIMENVKFQVSVPTPLAAVQRAIDPHYQAAVESHWTAAFERDLRRIQDNISHSQLAIQLDSMAEIFVLERAWEKQHTVPAAFGALGVWFEDTDRGVRERLLRAVEMIDADVDLGFHLCYGDLGHKHFMEPVDTAVMVAFTEELLTRIPRNISWIHMPVPKDRVDAAYFEPLRKIVNLLQVKKTTLVLGLVHANDLEGTKKRIEMARRILGGSIEWAVATECGLGRTPREELNSILNISRQVTQPLN